MPEASHRRAIALAMTGASGAPYGLRLLQQLLSAGEQVYLMLSKPAQIVLGSETDLQLPGRPSEIGRYLSSHFAATAGQLRVYGQEEWTAPVASGSATARAMVVCPCSMGTLASIAQGTARTLIERAADVMLKEKKTLILVPRETPLSTIHLENMLRLSRAGALLLAANPGFYHRPRSADDLVDYLVARILDHLGVEHGLGPRWGVDPE